MKKYRLGKKHPYLNLYQVVALVNFGSVRRGDTGGWIESKKNLSHDGNAWVYGDALVYGNAKVYGDARVYGNAKVYGDAWVYGNARVYGTAWVYGNARVYGNAKVYGDALVYGNAWVYGDALVYGNARVYGTAWVYGDALVYGNAKVYGDARVYGDAWVYGDALITSKITITPIQIIAYPYSIGFAGRGDFFVGCSVQSLQTPLKELRSLAKQNHFTQKQINEYKIYLALIKAWVHRHRKEIS